MKLLVTGGAGFIGSEFIRRMLAEHADISIINYDKLTYSADQRNLLEVTHDPRYRFVQGDISDFALLIDTLRDVDVIVHFAAESHVDNSIGNSLAFTQTNVYGTHVLLEAARFIGIRKFLHVSTDEVYGDIAEGSAAEDSVLLPNNPYSATKAGAEMLVRAYRKTYRLPIMVVRGNNAFGPYQYPEKIIPKFITLLIDNKSVPIHGDGSPIRTFVYVKDFARAVEAVLYRGTEGEIYNIGTSDEISNLALTELLIKKLGRDNSAMLFVPNRPFNDQRYSVDSSKIRNLGWQPQYTFDAALDETILWYQHNREWWQGKGNNDLTFNDTRGR